MSISEAAAAEFGNEDDGTDPGDKTSKVLDDADDAETHPDDAFNADADAFVDLCSRGLQQAESKINAVDLFKRLEYMNPKDARLRVLYQFVALVQLQPLVATATKSKPKALPKQLSMTTFLRK